MLIKQVVRNFICQCLHLVSTVCSVHTEEIWSILGWKTHLFTHFLCLPNKCVTCLYNCALQVLFSRNIHRKESLQSAMLFLVDIFLLVTSTYKNRS